ncbi:sensor histidine kinase [Sulfurimonas sp.]|uniref:sensor histidine kinase n=1 Tax=Sulfurimonas sp. TaxID=2022749 RepID=UPI003566920C
MHSNLRDIEFECLNSIGNSFELESMISEIMITYYRQTKAIYACYCTNQESDNVLINIGEVYKADFDRTKLKEKKCFSYKDNQYGVVILPLKIGYLTFVYKDKESDMEYLLSLISKFQQKINFAISACIGVEQLENFNKELEIKVEESVKKISEHEKLLLVRSKNVVMGEMIEMIAHQWRQPVTTIGMISNNVILNMLLDELDTEILKEDLEGINKQVKYLSDTIDDFRNFFKESKKEEEFILSDVIENSISILEKQFSKAQIDLTFEDNSPNTTLNTFKSELIQALINIISNAKEAFSPDVQNKHLKVACHKDEENVYITIADNAGGIKSDVIEKIFDPYFSTKKQKNGTGLGLYVCKIIICEHLKGDLSVENIDNGATFKITLPLKSEPIDK